MSASRKVHFTSRWRNCRNRKRAVPEQSKRRSFSRTYSAGSVVFALLFAMVAPGTSATADDGTDHRTFEERVVSIFESGLDGATLIGIPACGTGTTLDDGGYPATPYRTCAGEIKTWDGLELDARISFPTEASEALPLVVLLHGWGGNRNGVQGTPTNPGDVGHVPGHPGNNPTKGLSPARFLAKGYATLVYTARGFQGSCGAVDPAADVNAAGGTDGYDPEGCPPNGHTHLAERAFEVADTRYLLGLLVDARVADPRRLAAAGESYGGGQTWMLATAMPWETPAGTSTIQLAAAVPLHGWTDLYGSLVPNGRATDGVDQSASHEKPFGVVKQQWINEVYRGGRAFPLRPDRLTDRGTLVGGGRYNTTDPSETHSFFDGWMAAFSAGEPHLTQEAIDLPGAFRGKSAYYPVADLENDYLTQLAARRVRSVPIFAVQGWTDFAFPAVEALQMYRKLKAAHPGYPISMLLGDVGHGAQKPLEQDQYSWQQAGNFIDTHLGVATEGVPPAAVSFPTRCPATGPHVPLTSDNWDALVKPSPRTFSSAPLDLRRTDSLSSDLEEEMASEPFANAGHCIERPADKSASGAFWRWRVDSEFTMLGLPSVTLPYTMTGEDATVVVKLWDVGPEGPDQNKVLVTRGVYRLSAPGQPASSGSLTFQLFGNHWRFAEGHTMELEVGQLDRPFLRPDNIPSSIAYDGVKLSVPEAKG